MKAIPTILIPSESCGLTGDAKHKEKTMNNHLLLKFILTSKVAHLLHIETPNLLTLALILVNLSNLQQQDIYGVLSTITQAPQVL
jgi:hypothetical protein